MFVTKEKREIKAAIFDMDGLLLDTERLCKEIFAQACEAINIPFLEEVYLSIIGKNGQGVKEGLIAGYQAQYRQDFDYQEIHLEWEKRYHSVTHHQAIDVKEGVVELLEWLQSQDIRLAVATSSPKKTAQIKLELSGLAGYFDVLTTGDEVTHSKPNPEIYLLAASRLNIDPQYCIAFEDSNNGIRSCVAAQMDAYQIPDLVSPTEEIKQLGHHIYPSLHQVLQSFKLVN
ncbi:HAD family phosphatase [Vibrio sp. SS-MA-C1-2]|uniref:HAD family hydrolase n=1 Tax=Vibrio sp. SS-MA-C1-2 TaxID=2908646 RepID=UPI001F34727A|nr:HAD family phosphatase [Vibrio sp. SS-MA-C1-2]UJF18924.1 HAD family phosphatase [Vibrio sp. SS-MA-C1-2]